ncbi:DUF3313 domain-containing protein [Agrobacterium rhizogenes]|nr:DUF3313 domain-containing protein [Rhizobium rhizogenes]
MYPVNQNPQDCNLRPTQASGTKLTMSVALMICLSGCASMPLQRGTTLSSYQNLKPSNGTMTKSEMSVDPHALAMAKTVRIVPTTISVNVAATVPNLREQALTSNAVDRALCVALSDRFEIVGPGQPADLTVRASIVAIKPTNKTAAGVSTVTSLGTSAVLPVSVPRLPIGMGGLDAEAEAIGADGAQKAAMVWSRGADSFTTAARVSAVGDAYALAGSFGNDFAKMLVKGDTPFKGVGSLPSKQKVWSALGGRNKYAACESFGRGSGIAGAIGGKLGLPPGWTDKKSQANSKT